MRPHGLVAIGRLAALLVCLVIVPGCAARLAPASTAAELARAEQLASAGCYACLEEALSVYEQLLRPNRRPSPALRQAAFDTAILLVLRQKELGVASDQTLEKARAFSAALPAAPGRAPAATVLTLADLALVDPSGLDPDVSAARNTRERRAQLVELRSELSSASSGSSLETYLALFLDCNDGEARFKLQGNELLDRFGAVPLLRYRVAVCGFGPRNLFASIREADTRWIEAAFFEGRAAASGSRPNLRAAIDLFSLARPALPESVSLLLALAHAQRGYGDLEPALTSYDGVITMVPRHREALLGRAITLSYLEQHPEVIETTTTMIDYGTWLMGDAHYWRARSRYVLKQLEDAWSDAEQAVKLSPTTNVYTLAGVIAYDRNELDVAKNRFERARQTDPSNCTAHSYFALVNATQGHWPAATPVFSQAMSCFAQAAANAERELAQVEASDYDPVFKERLASQQRKTIAESTLKAAQAGYNAAQGLLREGKRSEALSHLQRALEHPEVKTQAEGLLKMVQ